MNRNETHSVPYIGIDFGTTNSAISFAKVKLNGEIASTALEIPRIQDAAYNAGNISYIPGRAKILPSCDYYGRDGALVGDYARAQYPKYPESVSKSVKSQMGASRLSDLSPDVPDKTPEDVCARILLHLKTEAERVIRRRITNAIFTIPANYGVEQREAMMKAAEKAGFEVRGEDGRWKNVLLSEPNAVLYDVVNRIQNGEIMDSVLDLSSRKVVLVFDIGGGTLDVTLHEIERSPEDPAHLDISEIAASRYTRLAGDDFDDRIADCLYERFLAKKNAAPGSSGSRMMRAKMRSAAEELKIRLSNKVSSAQMGGDIWFDDFETGDTEEVSETVSVMLDNSTFYNDTVSREEFEEMIAPLLGGHLQYGDYRRYATLSKEERRTILAPVLEVLSKAARYYSEKGAGDVCVDAVVLNGGMSNLFAIRERLKEFFGMEPITTSDPDLSVASGAAVYAYHMANADSAAGSGISIRRYIQNEDLYLGLGRGGAELLIRDGQELPYSLTIEGFRVPPQTRSLEIPIKRGSISGDFPTFARSVIHFDRTFRNPTDLRLDCSFDINGLISIEACLINETTGMMMASGHAELELGSGMDEKRCGDKILPKNGSRLVPANELSCLKALCTAKKKNTQKIDERIDTILNCSNLPDFEADILRAFGANPTIPYRLALYRILSGMLGHISVQGRTELRRICSTDIVSDCIGIASSARITVSDLARKVLNGLSAAV